MATLESIFPLNSIFPNNIEQTFAAAREAAAKKDAGNKRVDSEETAKTDKTQVPEKDTANSASPQSDRTEISRLAARDREVRAHEAAHKAAGGSLAGAAQFDYEQGPDGKRYAVGGEVSIDTSKVNGDPQATLQKANRIRAAALAPVNPSRQDRVVATQASTMGAEARIEIREAAQAEQEKQAEALEQSRQANETERDENGTASVADNATHVDARAIASNDASIKPASHAVNELMDFSDNTAAAMAFRPGAVIDIFA